MKTLSKISPICMVGLGAVGFGLRKFLYILAEDGKGLIRSGHPLEWALWGVAAGALVLALLTAKNENGSDTAAERAVSACGWMAAAIGIGLTVLRGTSAAQGLLGLVWKLMGIVCVAALMIAAKQRWEGKQPCFLFSAAVCVFFAVHMVSSYRGWSSNPQIIDYVFTLFANIFLILFAYQQGAVAADCGKPQRIPLFGTMAVFFCLVCLSGTENPVLYLTGGAWALTNLWIPVPTVEAEEEVNGEANDETA